MNNSKRLLTASLGALALMLAHAGISQAQFGVNNPWGRSVHGNPVVYGPNYLGTLPNGTPVINPWNRGTVVPAVPAWQTQFGYQYATYNAMNVWNPGLAPYWGAATGLNNAWAANAALAQGALLQPGGFGPGIQPIPIQDNIVGVSPGVQQGPFTQLEPGFFARVGPDVAINRTTGTVLRPYSGVAFTNEGPFYRMPGSGSFTPWGAYIPGTGMYRNPITGAAYNPQTGLIIR